MIYLVVFLCVFNIVTWIVFLRNFKKFFSTDDIINQTKAEYNQIVRDLNKNAERNVSLLDDRISKIKNLTDEADRKIRMLIELEKNGNALTEFNQKLNSSKPQGSKNGPLQKALDAYGKNQYQDYSPYSKGVDSSKKQEVPSQIKEVPVQPVVQTPVIQLEEFRDDTRKTFENDIVQEKTSVTVSSPEIVVKEIPSVNKQTLTSQIVTLFDSGYSVDQISEKMQCSTTEVQFALTIEGRI